jgi:hypothetical protein
MLIVITRIRYSRWAVLAGISAALCATNCLLLLTMDQGPAYRWINRNIANPDPANGLLFTGAMGWAPLSLVFSSLAVRQLRRNADLRGKWIARLAILAGILGTAFLVLGMVVFVWGNLLKKF